VDGTLLETPVQLVADPASPWTATQLGERHAFLQALFASYSRIDTLLNAIDAQEHKLAGASDPAAAAKRARLDALRLTLTSDARNDEDGIGRPDRIRERVNQLIGAIGSSFQPPFTAHLAAAAELQPIVDATLAHARSELAAIAGS
jgi:hypothetical protein